MKTYTDFPSQRPGNQWVGFRLLTAIPEVPVGHNSRENRILTIIVVGVFLVSSKALVWTGRDSSQGDNPHSLVWWEMLWSDAMWPKRLLFSFPFPVPHIVPYESSDCFTCSDLTLSTEVAEWNGHNDESEEKSINQTWRYLGTCASVHSYWADKVSA